MSRVHDALRRAEQMSGQTAAAAPAPASPVPAAEETESRTVAAVLADVEPQRPVGRSAAVAPVRPALPEVLTRVRSIPFTPSADAHLMGLRSAGDAPAEEFRSIRTRLNHLRTQQALSTIVVTSPSPAEGKSFAAANLAITQSQLENNRTLLMDCDFRRPIIHSFFQMDRSPGLTDYLSREASLEDCLRRIEDTELYVLAAGSAVVNPLELLNRAEMAQLLQQLPSLFNWTFLDSPPLLFAADANLLSTVSSGTVLVVRIGSTTQDSVTRAMQSLCHNNVLGVIANGARRGELYSKYTYYHSYYYAPPEESNSAETESKES